MPCAARPRARLRVLNPSPRAPTEATVRIDTVVPVIAWPGARRVGYVVRRDGPRQEEWYAELIYDDLPVLVPCRRVNRESDPYGIYILDDGSIWRSAWPRAGSIMGEVIRP